MWNADGKLEEDKNVKMPKCLEKPPKYQLCADMNTCKGSGASMVKDDGPLVGILGKDPSCENEVNTDEPFERTFAKVSHSDIWKFINDSKKGLNIRQFFWKIFLIQLFFFFFLMFRFGIVPIIEGLFLRTQKLSMLKKKISPHWSLLKTKFKNFKNQDKYHFWRENSNFFVRF